MSEVDEGVVIALGSNMKGGFSDTRALLEAALERLTREELKIIARSSWWRSAAWPDAADPAFVNGVILAQTHMGPHELMACLHRLEAVFGRDRSVRNAPRTLDLDLIAHGRRVSDEGGLILPHPRAHERLFVMGPLAEIAPHWRHPVSGVRADDLVRACGVGRDAHPFEDENDG